MLKRVNDIWRIQQSDLFSCQKYGWNCLVTWLSSISVDPLNQEIWGRGEPVTSHSSVTASPSLQWTSERGFVKTGLPLLPNSSLAVWKKTKSNPQRMDTLAGEAIVKEVFFLFFCKPCRLGSIIVAKNLFKNFIT